MFTSKLICKKKVLSISLSLIVFFCTSLTYGYSKQSLHDVYLANTEHELHVFRIYGKKPGKTIMLIGGIQGDEPGGYLTADLYADITLKQGNLIVVPRANFYSILLNQRNGLTGDMNRKFGKKDNNKKNMEQEIVSILKKLIDQSDCLLNLHEGSGFYHPEWINEMENPHRYGQSIIYDAKTYPNKEKGGVIELETLAQKIISRVNPQIENDRYHFKTNNHNTISKETKHKEQRKSATYYALTQARIPAFGVETSKSIKSNSLKVQLQKMIVNGFMEEFAIIPDTPRVHVEKTELDYVLVTVNNGMPYAVPNGSKIEVNSGDEVVITDIIANYNRGLAADFIGMGSYNDTKLPFRIAQSTKVVIRKDSEKCGWIEVSLKEGSLENSIASLNSPLPHKNEKTLIKPTKKSNAVSEDKLKAEKLLLNVNGNLISLAVGEEVSVHGDKLLIIKGIQSNISRLDSKIFVNLKGFAPPKSKNDGNDLNFPLYPKQDLWVRYSENKQGIRYPMKATYKNKDIGTFWLRVN